VAVVFRIYGVDDEREGASIALPAREAPPGKDVDDARGSFLVESLTVRLREG